MAAKTPTRLTVQCGSYRWDKHGVGYRCVLTDKHKGKCILRAEGYPTWNK